MQPHCERFFFVKVMKTGGGTFLQHVLANFERHEVYPDGRADPDLRLANMRMDYLLGLPPERHAEIKIYTGHFPYVAAQLLEPPRLRTITILREPVERTISYLKHCRRYHPQHRELSLEEIYEDAFFYPTLIRDHQTKLFSMTTEDKLDSYLDVIEIDAARLASAKANLEQVDVLGMQDRSPELLHEMADRFGWRFGDVRDRHVSPADEVPDAFRRRIAEDNHKDVEFFEFATELYHRRRQERQVSHR